MKSIRLFVRLGLAAGVISLLAFSASAQDGYSRAFFLKALGRR